MASSSSGMSCELSGERRGSPPRASDGGEGPKAAEGACDPRRPSRTGAPPIGTILDSQRMPHLHCHLLSSTAELALGKLLVSEIEHHKGDANGSQCFHKRPPNQLPPVKRQRLFELGHCEEKMRTAVASGEGHSRREGFGFSFWREASSGFTKSSRSWIGWPDQNVRKRKRPPTEAALLLLCVPDHPSAVDAEA